MFIPLWGLLVIVIAFFYLLVTDIRLHRRVRRLEDIVKKLEGTNNHQEEYSGVSTTGDSEGMG